MVDQCAAEAAQADQADPQAGQQVMRDLATTEFYFAAIGTLLLAVAGLCVQFGSGGKDAEKQGEEDEKEKD